MAAEKNQTRIAKQYRIHNILGQYHASNHDLTWIVEAQDSELVKQFFADIGLMEFKAISAVPISTFDDLNSKAKLVHNIL